MRLIPFAFVFSSLLLLLPGCFWGETEADAFFKVSAANFSNYEGLLFPEERAEAWTTIFEARPTVCVDGTDEGCSDGEWQRSDLLDLYMPYNTGDKRDVGSFLMMVKIITLKKDKAWLEITLLTLIH